MERWQDQALILSVRAHGEGGAVVTVLSESNGKHAGYVPHAKRTNLRGVMEPGNLVQVDWAGRTADNLGTFQIEPDRHITAGFLNDSLKLSALKSVMSLCDQALPERESYQELFHGTLAMIDAFDTDLWPVSYVMWEVSLMKVLGFALDFTRCAGGGSAEDLYYMSPKSGCTVSLEKGEEYKDKLLPLPSFLRSDRSHPELKDMMCGLELTRFFLENWVFAQHTRGIPEDRLRFQERFAKYGVQHKQGVMPSEPDDGNIDTDDNIFEKMNEYVDEYYGER
jgi:DNA repair protein RecO (recombination protein O)